MYIMWWLIWIWFGYVLQLADTEFEISTVPDADNYGLACIQPFNIFKCLKKCVMLSRYGTMYHKMTFMYFINSVCRHKLNYFSKLSHGNAGLMLNLLVCLF